LALEHRARVDVALEARAGEDRGEARGERTQERAHARVVVLAERVGGDPAGERRAPVAGRWRRRAVRVGEGDDAARPRARRPRGAWVSVSWSPTACPTRPASARPTRACSHPPRTRRRAWRRRVPTRSGRASTA